MEHFLKNDKMLKTCNSCREYQIKNRDVLVAKRNPLSIKATRKKSYMKNKAYYAETNKAFREANPEYSKNYYQQLKQSRA
jgi:hypothetical protein